MSAHLKKIYSRLKYIWDSPQLDQYRMITSFAQWIAAYNLVNEADPDVPNKLLDLI